MSEQLGECQMPWAFLSVTPDLNPLDLLVSPVYAAILRAEFGNVDTAVSCISGLTI